MTRPSPGPNPRSRTTMTTIVLTAPIPRQAGRRSLARGKVGAMQSSTQAQELAELMARVATGDQDAFAKLYDATSRSVYGIALRVLTDPAQAEEIAQEVYVDAWRTATRFNPKQGSVTAWLNTIAHRKAVDRVRSVERSRQREQRHAEASVDPPVPDVSETVVAQDEGRRVREALQALPPAQRTALELAYYEGRTHREIAEFLEIPLGTAKTRIRDAMQRLRRNLGEVAR
jgi:RNA polymerase sigma-70 factor, ECF subfamily